MVELEKNKNKVQHKTTIVWKPKNSLNQIIKGK